MIIKLPILFYILYLVLEMFLNIQHLVCQVLVLWMSWTA